MPLKRNLKKRESDDSTTQPTPIFSDDEEDTLLRPECIAKTQPFEKIEVPFYEKKSDSKKRKRDDSTTRPALISSNDEEDMLLRPECAAKTPPFAEIVVPLVEKPTLRASTSTMLMLLSDVESNNLIRRPGQNTVPLPAYPAKNQLLVDNHSLTSNAKAPQAKQTSDLSPSEWEILKLVNSAMLDEIIDKVIQPDRDSEEYEYGNYCW